MHVGDVEPGPVFRYFIELEAARGVVRDEHAIDRSLLEGEVGVGHGNRHPHGAQRFQRPYVLGETFQLQPLEIFYFADSPLARDEMVGNEIGCREKSISP